MKHKIICGDNKEILKGVITKSIDLTVTSPPYDDLRDYTGYVFDFKFVAKELYRVTKKGGVVVWVVGDKVINGSESGSSFKQALYFKEIGFNLHDTMIYEKQNPKPSFDKTRYRQAFEYMFVLTKGTPRSFNPIVKYDATKSLVVRSSFSERRKDGSLDNHHVFYDGKRVRLNNIWKYKVGLHQSSKDIISFKHPAIFPEELARDHIISWSNENDTILDPFLGSGTVSKMAEILNRNSIGIDISPDYCEDSYNRLLSVIRQGRLSRKPSTIERINF